MNIPLNIDWQQILLHLLNFAILAGGLYLLLYKPVKKFMAQRTDYYQHLEDEAQAKLQQAQDLEADAQAQLQNAESEIAEKRANAQLELEHLNAQRLQEAKQQAEKIISDAQQNAERERAKIIGSAQKEIEKMVTTATEKLLLQSTVSEAFDQFLTAAERSEQYE